MHAPVVRTGIGFGRHNQGTAVALKPRSFALAKRRCGELLPLAAQSKVVDLTAPFVHSVLPIGFSVLLVANAVIVPGAYTLNRIYPKPFRLTLIRTLPHIAYRTRPRIQPNVTNLVAYQRLCGLRPSPPLTRLHQIANARRALLCRTPFLGH